MRKPYPVLRWTLLPFIRSRIWTVRGIENIPDQGGYILTPNHQSWIDSAIVAAAVYRHVKKPIRFIAQSNKYGFFGGLPIDSRDRAHVLDVALAYLSAGSPVVIFPEGNSNTNIELRMGRTGAARLALRSGLPVIPVGIRGTGGARAWQSVAWFFSLIRPCHVTFGRPLSFPQTEIKESDTQLLYHTTNQIMTAISEVSGKPLPGHAPSLDQRGFFWTLVWRVFRPLWQWRVRIHGHENIPDHGPFIIAANHSSYLDAPALAAAIFHVSGLQPMFPTKASVAQTFHRLLGAGGLTILGMIPLNEADRASILRPIIEHLGRHGVVAIFPEGTRNKEKLNPNWRTEHLKAKTGAARLAIETRVPIIPAAIQAPPGIGILEAILNAFLPWRWIRIKFGPAVVFENLPIDMTHATKNDLEQATRTIMHRISAMTGLVYKF